MATKRRSTKSVAKKKETPWPLIAFGAILIIAFLSFRLGQLSQIC